MTGDPTHLEPALGLLALTAALVDRDRDGLVIKDAASGVWLHVNATMAQWLGQPAEALIGQVNAGRLGDAAANKAADQSAAGQAGAVTAEVKLDLQGLRREFSVLRLGFDAPDGRRLVAVVWHDVGPARQRESQLKLTLAQLEQLQLANEQLRKQAQGSSPREGASSVYNLAHFEDQLRREVDLSTREHREFALVSITVDPLADAAGALGPKASERVIDALANLLRNNTRAMDASCRYDESHFVVLLSGVGLATAHSRMEGLRRQCATQIVVVDGQDVGFTVSMGVASFPHTAQSQDELQRSCEAALTDAVQRGGNRVALASIRFDTA